MTSTNLLKSTTQKAQVYRYMLKHGSISTRDATDDLNVYRLAARIFELKQEGLKIAKETKVNPETKKQYARYSLLAD